MGALRVVHQRIGRHEQRHRHQPRQKQRIGPRRRNPVAMQGQQAARREGDEMEEREVGHHIEIIHPRQHRQPPGQADEQQGGEQPLERGA